MSVIFTVSELTSIPAETLNKLLSSVAQAEQEIKNAKIKQEEANRAIKAYKELDEICKSQKELITEQEVRIKLLREASIPMEEHEKIVEELKNEYEERLENQKNEIKRLDDLLYSYEEENKILRNKCKELEKYKKAAEQYKKLYENAEATGNLLAKELIKIGYTLKRKQKDDKITINIQNYFEMNDSLKTIEDIFETHTLSCCKSNQANSCHCKK